MKKIFLSLTVILGALSLNAQVIYDYLKAADEYFRNGDYYSASQYYEKYLGKGNSKSKTTGFSPYSPQSGKSSKKSTGAVSSREQAIYNLAESYRNLHFHVKAEPYYLQASTFNKEQFPLAKYWYASTLRALEKYAEAETMFTQFQSEYTGTDKYKNDAAREIANLKFIQTQLARKDLDLYTVAKTGGETPDSGAVYAPVLFNDMLYFTSTKADNAVPRLQVHNNRVYQASYTDGMLNNVTKTSLPEINDIHQGVISLTADGNTLYLTRWTIAKGKKTSSIYTSKRSGDSWSQPTALSADINVPGFNSQQAYVMADGKQLLFSSDQPGTMGGYDLWVSDIDANGNASKPVNMGATINTINDEQAPFYHALSNSLVFSSNGRVGMGGFDFFHSKGSVGNWAEPQNFGYPVNSVKEDIYFTSRGRATNILEDVLLSSDRADACCLELFSLRKKKPLKSINGTVVVCETKQPLEGAKISFVDPTTGKVVLEKTTDATGSYSFTLEEYQKLKATATLTGYFTNSVEFNTPQDAESDILMNGPLCLTIIPEVAITVDNVYYDFNKASLKPESYPSLDKLVTLLNDNPTMDIELSAHTDSKGTDEYNLKLSDARAKSVVDYLISKGIVATRLIAKGYGETAPVAENANPDGTDNPDGRQKNRRTEFKVLKN